VAVLDNGKSQEAETMAAERRPATGQTKPGSPRPPVRPAPPAGGAARSSAGGLGDDWVLKGGGGPAKRLSPGTQLGSYKLVSVLGRGGMGVVFKAEDAALQRQAAVKFLTDPDLRARERFMREARLAAGLGHPNIVTVYQVGEFEGFPYIVTELMAGGSLDDMVEKEGPLAAARAIEVIAGCARGLAFAHSKGIVHRDIKPGNLLAAEDGLVKIGDFGLAKGSGDAHTHVTQPGGITGTPLYVAPEICSGEKASGASDIYALGLTLYYLLTGRHAFMAETVIAVITNHLSAPLPDPGRFGVRFPDGLMPILERSVAKDPAERYASASEFASALEAFLNTLADRRVGTQVGDYKITGMLGKGGMGAVYQATDQRTGAVVALKILSSELSAQGPEHTQRFLREGRIAAALKHPNIVEVKEVGKAGDLFYIAMELVRGMSADDLLKKNGKPLGFKGAVKIIREAARGLAAVHAGGIVHRDIKPANIMLDEKGVVRLADFGLAKAKGGSRSVTVTGTGKMMGTPAYMSPEQVTGQPVDARSDIYSLGATFYTLLAGTDPYHSENTAAVIFGHVHKPTPDPRLARPDAPDDCCRIIFKAMAKDPQQRYQTAEELLGDLDAIDYTRMGGAEDTLRPPVLEGGPMGVSGFAPALLSPPSHVTTAVRTLKKPKSALPLPPVALAALSGGLVLGLMGVIIILKSGARTPEPTEKVQKPAVVTPPVVVQDPPDPEPTPTPPPVAPVATTWRNPVAAFEVEGHSDSVVAVAFAPDGKTFATGGGVDRFIRIWNAGKEEPPLHTLAGHTTVVTSIDYAPDSRQIASGSNDGFVRLWDAVQGREGRYWRPHTNSFVRAVAFSPDGRMLVTGGRDHRIAVWDPAGGGLLAEKQMPATVQGLSFAVEVPLLAVGSGQDEGYIHIFNTRDWSEVFKSHHPTRELYSLALSPDGKTLAATFSSSSIEVWRFQAGQWSRVAALEGHTGGVVHHLTFSSDSKILASAGHDTTVRLWDMTELKPLSTIRAHKNRCQGVAFSPDMSKLVSISKDGAVKVWKPGPEE
jgi:serine/threonine protein kinase